MTSQIFANIYLNEFDRFVRHHLKPLGYVRYGDDFVLFAGSKSDAEKAHLVASRWLKQELKLAVHPRNNVIVRANRGLFFLGHAIFPTSVSADVAMCHKVKRDITTVNAASYRAMQLPKRLAKQLPWLLLDARD